MPQISVIIPLLNKGPYIKRALDSVIAQKFQNYEVIVIDGGSHDNGPDIVRNYKDSRIKFMQQIGKGVSTARNQAVNASCSNLIAFLDADDEWCPKHLEKIMELQKKYPKAGAYTTSYKIKEKNGRLRWAKYRAIPPSPWEGLIPNYFRSAALGEFPVWTSAVCTPKSIFLEMGGFVEDAWWGEDADLWGKIALKYPIAFSWECGAIYHWDSEDRACNKPSLDVEPFIKTANTAIENNSVPDYMKDYLIEYMARKELYRAACNIWIGNNERGNDILNKTETRLFLFRKIFLKLILLFPNKIQKDVMGYIIKCD